MRRRRNNTESHAPDEHKLAQAIADRLQQPIDSEVVQHVMLLHLQREALKLQILQGGHVPTSDIVALDNALDKFIPRPKFEVKVTFADPVDAAKPGTASVCALERCRRCGWVPPNNDAVSICFACSWVIGCDEANTPRRPLIAPSEPTPQPGQAVASESVVPFRKPPQLLSDEDRKANRMVELRAQARPTGGEPAPIQSPRINYNSGGGGSCSDLMRRIENSYR
jgi:hypothetical protein